ncbi:MAG: alpha/beta hydrolase [Gammaproteobacteria bacterium]|nr:alpha/beta hydrolase [Gammaproteobacteria bacterium]
MSKQFSPELANKSCWPKLAVFVGLALFSNVLGAQANKKTIDSDSGIAFSSAVVDQYRIHFAYAGDRDKPGIIFLHGTPGSWPAFEKYLANKSLQEDYFMVSVDRLGWGKSRIGLATGGASRRHAKTTSAFLLQARSIASVMRLYPAKKWLLVGHSLGSSIAPKIALLEDNKVAGMLLLSGSLDPRLGKPRWYNQIAGTLLVKWMLPRALKFSNDEIMGLQEELRHLESELATRKLAAEVVIMQGLKDRLVSPQNTSYVMKNWPRSFKNLRSIALPDAGHFLPWEQSELVIETIRQFKF